MYVCVYVHASMCVYMHKCTHKYMHICVCIHIYVHVNMKVHTYVSINMNVMICMPFFVSSMFIFEYRLAHVPINICKEYLYPYYSLFVYMYVQYKCLYEIQVCVVYITCVHEYVYENMFIITGT